MVKFETHIMKHRTKSGRLTALRLRTPTNCITYWDYSHWIRDLHHEILFWNQAYQESCFQRYLQVGVQRIHQQKHSMIDGQLDGQTDRQKTYLYIRFILVGTNYRGFNKKDTFVGFKIHGQSIFFHNSYRKLSFVGTGIRGSNHPRKIDLLI